MQADLASFSQRYSRQKSLKAKNMKVVYGGGCGNPFGTAVRQRIEYCAASTQGWP